MVKFCKNIYLIKSLFLFSIILLISCNKDRTIGPHKCYLHLSHTRTNSNLFLNDISKMIDFNRFDMLWLGGDLALSTSSSNMTMEMINNIYNIEDRNTLWSLGNHDYTDIERIQEYLKQMEQLYLKEFRGMREDLNRINEIEFKMEKIERSLKKIIENQEFELEAARKLMGLKMPPKKKY